MDKILGTRSIKTYVVSLAKLKKIEIDIDNINIDELIATFNKMNMPITSQNSYLSALLWYYRKNKKDEDTIKKISEKIREIRGEISDDYEENEFSKKEKEKYVKWDIILNIYDDLKNKVKNNSDKRINEDFLILSLYILHPPRRADYQNMYIDDVIITDNKSKILWINDGNLFKNNYKYKINKKDEIEKQKQDRVFKNYYVQKEDKSFFVFDDYKTFPIYGRQIIEVQTTLDNIIKDFIKKNNLKKGDKLINLSYTNYIKRLNEIFISYIKKSISVSMLRHTYIIYLLNNNLLKEREKKKLSSLMAHSVKTQSIYRKDIQEEYDVDEVEIDYDEYDNKKKYGKYTKYENDEERKKQRQKDKKLWYEKNKEKLAKQRKEKNEKITK